MEWITTLSGLEVGVLYVVLIALLGLFAKRYFASNDERLKERTELIIKYEKTHTEYKDILKENQKLLLSNQEIISDCTIIMKDLSGRYEELKEDVNEGFKEVKDELKEVYRICLDKKDGD